MSSHDTQETWPSPAKLNLMLRILEQRADGYHNLQTVFQFIDLCDQLSFSINETGLIGRVQELHDIPLGSDLSIRAAKLLKEHTGCEQGVNIHIQKQIPIGGGLGGGSSNAATTLVALNQLWETNISSKELAQIGLKLGADVPIFIHGSAAWAEGVGEQLFDIEIPEPCYLVIQPACKVSTKQIFQDPNLTRSADRITIRDFFAGHIANDCQTLVAERYPQIKRGLDWLGRHGEPRLTGTGSCIFTEVATREEAGNILQQLPEEFSGFVARGINYSPLTKRLM